MALISSRIPQKTVGQLQEKNTQPFIRLKCDIIFYSGPKEEEEEEKNKTSMKVHISVTKLK